MKKRVLSAIVAFLIFIPIFLIGGTLFNVAFYIVTILGIREFMKIRDKKIPDFIRFIVYLLIGQGIEIAITSFINYINLF